VLESGDAPNLKTTLKNIIRAAVINTEGNDGYQSFLTDREVRDCGSPGKERLLRYGRARDFLRTILTFWVNMLRKRASSISC
jgi:hypothetical protein